MSPATNLEMGYTLAFRFVGVVFQYMMLHGKWRYINQAPFSSAVYFAWMPKIKGYLAANALSYRGRLFEVHLAPGCARKKERGDLFLFMGGIAIDTGKTSQFMIDYVHSDEVEDLDIHGMITAGWRVSSGALCWDLGGMHLLHEDANEGFSFWPYVKVTWSFGK